MTITLTDIETTAVKLAHMLPHLLRGDDILEACRAVEKQEREASYAAALVKLDRERDQRLLAEAMGDRLVPPAALAPNWDEADAWANWYSINCTGTAYYSEHEPHLSEAGYSWVSNGDYARCANVAIPLGIDWRILKYPRPASDKPRLIIAKPSVLAEAQVVVDREPIKRKRKASGS